MVTATRIGLIVTQHSGDGKANQYFLRGGHRLPTRGHGAAGRGLVVTAMAHDGEWRSTDQIPQRATRPGCELIPFCISRFGYVDPTDGGESHRYSLSFDGWSRDDEGRGWTANAYGLDYHLKLISNFTYAVDQEDGDQFEQYDDRQVFGGSFVYARPASFTGAPVGLGRARCASRLG